MHVDGNRYFCESENEFFCLTLSVNLDICM